jgi:hypothetical protein
MHVCRKLGDGVLKEIGERRNVVPFRAPQSVHGPRPPQEVPSVMPERKIDGVFALVVATAHDVQLLLGGPLQQQGLTPIPI